MPAHCVARRPYTITVVMKQVPFHTILGLSRHVWLVTHMNSKPGSITTNVLFVLVVTTLSTLISHASLAI